MIPLRLYIYAGLALAFAGLAVALKVQTGRLDRVKDENRQLTATVKAERENVRKANEASEKYAISLENLKAARAATPTRSVRLCVNSSVPEAGASPRADAADSKGLSEAPGRNIEAGPEIGPDVYNLADEADLCPAKLEALQQWIRDR
jgi:hypothetical protein